MHYLGHFKNFDDDDDDDDDFSYPHKRSVLSLDKSELRRLHCDLIMCYKIVFNIVKLEFTDFFSFILVTATHGHPAHPYRLFVPFAKNTARKNFFAYRVLKPWNYLPAHVVDFSALNRFKKSLHKVDYSSFITIE